MFAAVLALVLAIQSAPVQQTADLRTWYQAYADGQKAVQDKNWQKAINDLIVAAQRGAPKPARNVLFYGDVYRDYNPDYYLGIAYSNLQRFTEADTAFERVKQAGLLGPRDSAYAEFTRQAANVKDILSKQAAQVRQTAPPGNGANTASNANNADIPLPPNTGRTTGSAPAKAPASTNAAPTRIPTTAANAPANRVVQQPVAPDPKAAAGPPVPRNPVASPPVPAYPSPAPVSVLPLATAAVKPFDERSAVVQFFSGDYEAAAAALAVAAYSTAASPRAHFYLACARAALVLTGKAPRSSLDAARAELALANDYGQFASDKRFISPRIKQELRMQP